MQIQWLRCGEQAELATPTPTTVVNAVETRSSFKPVEAVSMQQTAVDQTIISLTPAESATTAIWSIQHQEKFAIVRSSHSRINSVLTGDFLQIRFFNQE